MALFAATYNTVFIYLNDILANISLEEALRFGVPTTRAHCLTISYMPVPTIQLLHTLSGGGVALHTVIPFESSNTQTFALLCP